MGRLESATIIRQLRHRATQFNLFAELLNARTKRFDLLLLLRKLRLKFAQQSV